MKDLLTSAMTTPAIAPLGHDGRVAKRTASIALRTNGMRLHLIWAALICFVLSGGSLYLIESLFAVVPWTTLYHTSPLWFHTVNVLYTMVDIAYTVLVIFPLIYGTACIFYTAADGQKLPLSNIFRAYDRGKDYRRAVAIISALALPRMLLLLALRALCHIALDTSSLLHTSLVALLALLLLAGASLLLGVDDALLPLALQYPDERVAVLYRRSLSLARHRLVRIWLFKLTYLGWGVLSVLTLGVLFFGHALPYYCLSHTVWTDSVYRKP